MIGSLIDGKYFVQEEVARGGMGRIYKAEQRPLGRTVALKVLHPRFTLPDEDFQSRFFREASILSRLQHPNIVTVFDYGRVDLPGVEAFFTTMEFLQGETLLERLKRDGTLEAVHAVQMFEQLARGLREAHAQGVIHRDLKPSNVMLVPQADGAELVKLLDFGLVKVLHDNGDDTQAGTLLGSPRYMSPEQIARGPIDQRTDVYSLGVMLYHALCGVVPFEGETHIKTLVCHMHKPVPPMKERNPDSNVPEAIEQFVRRCLEKDASKRIPGMERFGRELKEAAVSAGSGEGPASDRPLRFDSGSGAWPTGPFVEVSTGPVCVPPRSERAAVIPVTHTLTSNSPPAPQRSRARLLALAALAVIVAGGAALGVRSLLRPAPSSPASAAASPPAAPRPAYSASIESAPSGAEIYDQGRLAGRTPTQLRVDNDAARSPEHAVELRLAGYQSQRLPLPPSEKDLKLVVTLVPEAAQGSGDAAAAAQPPRPRGASTQTSKPKPTAAPPSDNEIRMQR